MNKESREPSEIPRPRDKFLLVDLDGTLINHAYQITDEQLHNSIAVAQNAGWTVGLSSDTPIEQMRIWLQRFGMNGPIIAERGAIVALEDELLYDQVEFQLFSDCKRRTMAALSAEGIELWFGNPVEAIRNKEKLGTPGSSVILVNQHRRCSLGLFAREVRLDGELEINPALTSYMAAIARPFYPHFDDIDEDLNHQFGLVIASRKSINKRRGSITLMKRLGLTQYGMIGNSMGDFVGDDLAIHYSVGDASEEFKNKSNYTASKSVTGGVVEILNKLSRF